MINQEWNLKIWEKQKNRKKKRNTFNLKIYTKYTANVVLFMGACTESNRMAIVTELLSVKLLKNQNQLSLKYWNFFVYFFVQGNVESMLKKHPDMPLSIRLKMAKGMYNNMKQKMIWIWKKVKMNWK